MNSKTKRIFANIAFYLVLVLIYGVAIFALINKFNKETLYFFNNRVDIVLTDSMSVRNENHADFLADTKQIQPFDIVVSKEIKDDTELNEKDCVLFKNPNYNNEVVVHRIVHIYEEGVSFKINNAEKTTFNNGEVFSINALDGEVTMATLDYTSISITAYSTKLLSSYYVISQGKNIVSTTVETTTISENVYKHVINYSRESSAPYKTFITAGTDEEIYISSITYDSKSQGILTFNASELTLDENHSFKKLFNPYYLYEIRADKSNSSDGIFERKELMSKVTTVIPKIGHITHFLQSIPGIIMLVGLTVIITVASFFWNKNINKKPVEPKEEAQEVSDKPEDNK